jgi:hypothetical protein
MACSICKQDKHNIKTCENKNSVLKKKFIDFYGDKWDEMNSYLANKVMKRGSSTIFADGREDFWWFFDQDELASFIRKKISFKIKLLPLEHAFWRYHSTGRWWSFSDAEKGIWWSNLNLWFEGASKKEQDAFMLLRKASWEKTYEEASLFLLHHKENTTTNH